MGLTSEQKEKLLQDVAEMKAALIGDARYKQKGLVGDVSDLKIWKEDIAAKWLWVSGAVAASWFFIGIIGYVGYEWVKTKIGIKE